MRLVLTCLISISILVNSHSQGIEFFHGTWKEAVEFAKKQNKPLFVDAYAKWCGPCKRMAATTFMDKVVGEFFNKNFINVKIDCEEEDGLKFRKSYPVTAYPTLYFIGNDEEVIHRAVGAQDDKGLIRLGEFALSKIDYSVDFAEKYDKGDRSPQLMYDYVEALNKSGKASLRIANEYLRTQENLNTEFNLRFLLEATTEADSRIFSLLIENKDAVIKMSGQQVLNDKIEYACEKTVRKAIEFKSPELLTEAIDKMKSHYPDKAKLFAAISKLNYFASQKDSKNYLQASKEFYKIRAKNDPELLRRHSAEILSNFAEDENCMKLAEKYAKQAATKSNTYDYYLNYAEILLSNGKIKEAKVAAQKSLELAKEDKDVGGEQASELLIRRIDG